MSVCHLDERGCPHLHLDMLVITEDNRLSSKTLITRDFITSMHRVMPKILQNHGFAIDDYEETEEKKQGGLSDKEYKKRMEQEKAELSKKIDEMAEEYNKLADMYNNLIDEQHALEKSNMQKAYEVIYQKEKTK